MMRIPDYISEILEERGLEEEVAKRGPDLYIECPDFEMAYDIRSRINNVGGHQAFLESNQERPGKVIVFVPDGLVDSFAF